MKLRTDGTSIRLRIRRSEVASFAESGRVASRIVFPDGCLEYSLEAAGVPAAAVSFREGAIRIVVPRAAAGQWTASDDVGIYGVHNHIAIVIEKDFRRTSQSSPDDHDRYPNPRASCAGAEKSSVPC